MEHYQNKPLADGTVLVVVSTETVSLEHITQAFIATKEQFEKAKMENEAEQPESSNVIDIGEWKVKHADQDSGGR